MKYLKKFESHHPDVEALTPKDIKLLEKKSKPANFSDTELGIIKSIQEATKGFSKVDVMGNTIKISPKTSGPYVEIKKFSNFFTKKSGEKDRFTKHDVYHTSDIKKVLND